MYPSNSNSYLFGNCKGQCLRHQQEGASTYVKMGQATVSGASSTNGQYCGHITDQVLLHAGSTTLTPTYTAAAGDAGNTVTLTMTVSNAPCTAATATYSVIVQALPTASAGGSKTICQNGTATVTWSKFNKRNNIVDT